MDGEASGMGAALEMAKEGLELGEVPVGVVIE